MATTNHYDLIVLGSDVAGLVAAALVARRGKRVLVIPHGSADGTYRLGGKPTPLRTAPVVHMGTAPVRRVWTELGLAQQVRRQHAPLQHRMHVVFPDRRIDLLPAAANIASEAARAWPDTEHVPEAWALAQRWADATDEVLDPLLSSDTALVADGFWSRRFLTRVEGQLPAADVDEMAPLDPDHDLRRAASAVVPWLQHLDPSQLGKAAGLRLRGLWGRGPEDMPGGEAALRRLLLQRIELHSGEVKRELRVAELLVKRSRVVGVSLLGKRDRYGCDHVIVATDPTRLLDGPLAPETLPRPLLEALQGVEVLAHRYVAHVEIAASGLSPALDALTVRLPATRGPAGVCYVRVGPGEHEDTRRLSLCRIVEAGASLDTMRESLLDELDAAGVLPFCHDHVRWMHSPHDGRPVTDAFGRPVDDRPATGSHPMDPLYALRRPASLGIGVLPQASGLKSMHVACRLTLPGLGLEGEFAAGTVAAGAVVGPARSPFSRSPLLSRA
ncbi:MAG: hypothetical protein AAGA54_34460 [Myxococcota bacterium]